MTDPTNPQNSTAPPANEPPARPVYPEHPDDVRADGGSRVVGNYAACQSHCCIRHGCKYGYHGCPVVTGQVTQDHPCERCTDPLWESETSPAKGEVGYTLTLAAKRTATEGSQSAPMAGMPTDTQVAAKVAEALTGLDLGGGWSLTHIAQEH